jgi:sterol desaturase/sphingolipid hydroxylase (fatty acid hydroxylase superfamily)
MQTVLIVFVPIALALVLLEWRWGVRRGRPVYEGRETLATVGLIAGMRFSRLLALPFQLWVFSWFEPFAWLSLPATVPVFLGALVVTDLVFYAYHRASHEVPLLWAIHQTHHSAEHLNLLAAGRLNWLGPWVIQPITGLPLVLLGVPGEVVIAVAFFDLVYQFFLHTEAIPRLRWLEPVLNTPAAHRFHHARNEGCLDVNYAGVFTVWDRLFGTWVEPDLPTDELRYGLTSGHHGNNPVWLVVGGLVRWMRRQPI